MSDHKDQTTPPFEPLFTLLTNTTTNTTIHPRVRYLFLDDDQSLPLTTPNSLIIDLQPTTTQEITTTTTTTTSNDPTSSSSSSTNTLGKWTISQASSLSPHFALTNARLQNTSIRLEAVQRDPLPPAPAATTTTTTTGADQQQQQQQQEVEALAGEFRRRMDVLGKVVDMAAKSAAAAAAAQGEDDLQEEEGGEKSVDSAEP